MKPDKRRAPNLDESDPAKIAKLRVIVEDEHGEVVYESWQEAEHKWRNCFLRFGEGEPDLLGQPIGSSWWDVPDPIKLQRAMEELDGILKATAVVEPGNVAARVVIGEALDRMTSLDSANPDERNS